MNHAPEFLPGDPIPFTPAETTELLRPYAASGDLITADLINRALAQARADGTLPAHIQARLDDYAANGQAPEVAAAWRARSRS